MKANLRRRLAFSLVECVVALGIVSFAFLTLIGLLPLGLQQFQTSKAESVRSAIEQYVDTQIQETQYSALTNTPALGGMQNAQYGFDEEGFPVTYQAANQVYVANTSVTTTGVTVPSSTSPTEVNASLAIVTVAILKQPGAASAVNAQTNAVLAIYASDRGQ